ncbi:MAG: hypothetical protein ACN4GZ_05820 [Acidimicrobiales bacterium]
MTEAERTRLQRYQLRTLVLDAGAELLHEEGLGAKTAPLGYAEAFRWLAEHRSLTVSRAQVHRRIWNSLEEYREEVMANMVRYGWPGEVLEATVTEVDKAIDELDLADKDAEARLNLLCDLARQLTDHNADQLRNLRSIAAADAIFAMHSLGAADKPGSPGVSAALLQNKTEILERYIELYSRVGDVFGATPGEGWGLSPTDGMRMYAETLSCLNQGAAGRSSFERTLQEIELGDQLWSVEGLCVHALTGHVASVDGPRAQEEEDCVVEPLLVTDGNKVDRLRQPEFGEEVPETGTRMERNTLRRHMIEAGMAILLEKGFGHGAEQITYSRVFDRIKERHDITVARAQVHRRIWRSQNHFQLELLAIAAQPNVMAGVQRATERAAQALDGLDVGSPGMARVAASRVVRAAAVATVEELERSEEWLLGRAIMSFHALNRTRTDIVGDALHQEYEAGIANWAGLFEAFALALGYQPRTWTGRSLSEVCEIAARCTDVLTDGVIARARMLNETATYPVSMAGDQSADWNLLGIGAWCVIDFLLEPGDPG